MASKTGPLSPCTIYIVYHNHVTFFQIRVSVTDGGNPAKTATATVICRVNRNLNAPSFEPERVDLELLENHPLGVPIVDVNATDRDTKVGNILIVILRRQT